MGVLFLTDNVNDERCDGAEEREDDQEPPCGCVSADHVPCPVLDVGVHWGFDQKHLVCWLLFGLAWRRQEPDDENDDGTRQHGADGRGQEPVPVPVVQTFHFRQQCLILRHFADSMLQLKADIFYSTSWQPSSHKSLHQMKLLKGLEIIFFAFI